MVIGSSRRGSTARAVRSDSSVQGRSAAPDRRRGLSDVIYTGASAGDAHEAELEVGQVHGFRTLPNINWKVTLSDYYNAVPHDNHPDQQADSEAESLDQYPHPDGHQQQFLESVAVAASLAYADPT